MSLAPFSPSILKPHLKLDHRFYIFSICKRPRAVIVIFIVMFILLLVGEIASENLPTFAANLLGIFPPRNFVGQNINPQLPIWLRIYILS